MPLTLETPAQQQRYAQLVWQFRQANDPLRQFVPHAGQRRFAEALFGPEAHDQVWAICANRWGKSDILAWCVAYAARYGWPDTVRPAVGTQTVVYDRATSGWMIGPDNQTMMHTILPKIFDNGLVPPGQAHQPFIPPWEVASWNQHDQVLKLKNGSILRAKSNEQDTIKFAAAGLDYIGFDEEPKLAIYEESTLRVEAGRRLRLFGAATLLPPAGQTGGVSWLYPRLIQPFVAGQADWVVLGGAIYDNPHLLPSELRRLESLYPVGSVTRRIRLGGEWLPGIGGARKYGNFARSIHCRLQGPPSPYLPLCWAWDFNVMPMVSLVGQYRQGRFYGLRELVLDEGSVPEMVDLFRQHYPAHHHEIWLYGDATGHDAGRNVNDRTSSYQVILNHMRTYPSPVRMKVPTSNPPVALRVDSVNTIFRGPEGESRAELDPSMHELADDFEQVVDDGRGGIKKSTNRKDPYSRRTGLSDAWGYWITATAPVKLVPALGATTPPIAVRMPGYSQGAFDGRG